jgi:hypothetical protein
MSILLRRDKKRSHFRGALLELARSEGRGDILVISSGFMYSNILENDNSLYGAICNGLPNGGTVKLMGGSFGFCNSCQSRNCSSCNDCKNNKCHYCNFISFVREMVNNLHSISNNTVRVEGYFVPNYQSSL